MQITDTVVFKNLPELRSNSITLRKICVDDASDIFEFASVEEVAKHVLWKPHSSISDTKEVLNSIMDNYRKGNPAPWGITLRGEKKVIGFIGFSYIDFPHRRAEVHFVLSNRYWNRGYTTEALLTVISYGFHSLALNRIEGRCAPENSASERVMKKAGMKYEGTLREQLLVKGKFTDLKIFSILKKEYAPD